jgi:DNA polymerase I-like protein with 3'-5' exonuclease and polymerase domains
MYLTNLAYLKGVRLSLPRLMELEKEDDEVFKHNWKILREFLFEQGWAGTRKPVYEEITAAAVKEVCEIVVGEEFTTRKKKLPAVAGDLREAFPDNDVALTLAAVVESNSLESFNALVDKSFTGEPKINFNSPRQIQKLLYGSLGMTPRIYNKLTEKERSNEEMREAFNALRRINDGKTVAIKEEWRAHWMKKASTDDQAIDLALAKDELTDAQRQAMVAYLRIKEVSTRRQMFYGPYKKVAHWSDGRIHPYFNQCATVTKRYSSSGPNLQQLPSSSGFRGVLLAHHKDAVVVSLDFNAQEIRATAHASQDKALISCYVGENKFDVHSLVAVRAAPYVWGQEVTYEEFVRMRKAGTPEEKARAEALRKGAKATLFGTVYGIAAPKLALQLKTDEDTAQKFLDALDEAFPGVNIWKEKTTAEAHAKGYSTTLLGDRRHLSTGLRSSNRGEESRAERQACNAVIQGSSAAQVKLAMSRMWDSDIFTSGKYDAEFIATIHDECVASVHKSQVVEFVRDMHKCMTEKFADMGIPAVSSIALGRDFTCPIEVGEDVDEGAILKAVEELFEGDV